MKFLTDTSEIDINIQDLTMDIDMIFHREITDKTGITVNHRDIQKFIYDTIDKNNKKQLEIRRRDKELNDSVKKFDEIYDKKIRSGKVITDRNSIKNIINYYIFNYILITPSGCGTTPGDITQCVDCAHEYDSEECKRNRDEHGFILAYMHQRFI